MRYLWLIGVVVVLLSGCGPFKVSEDCACVGVLRVNGDNYTEGSGEYTPGELVGKVKERVDPSDDIIVGNFRSDTLEVETEIYQAVEDESVLLAKISDDEYEVFIKE
ncbi:hypothetical protein GCM10008967_07420 [Bacillus carboniphilus]|uniref:Lipoprotein n=1 Tax=Bacillus carboniphilus TaxID=86663 RepID=A0ABN0VXC4_9BACI